MGKDKEKKKGGKIRKFFLFAAIAGAFAAVMKAVKGRRGGPDESEWQELPPPSNT
jgi:hypothetical protein